jgi:signal transduction histidine kinase
MRQRSLRLRLLALAALFIGIALMIAGVAIGLIFVNNVERAARADLVATLDRLVASIEPDGPELVPAGPLPDPRYDTPLSGAYWQIENLRDGTIRRSPSLLDVVIETTGLAAGGAEAFATVQGPDGQPLSVLVRDVRFVGLSLRVLVAESRAPLEESIRQFGGDLVIALAVLGAVLIAASSAQVWLGLGPLEAMRGALGEVRQGRCNALPPGYPVEVQPLATEINGLLEAQGATLEFARARAADLAHSLKTPLSVMRTLSPRLAEAGDPEGAALLERLVNEMDDRVAYQLRLSRLRHRTREHRLSVPLAEPVARAVDVLKRTPSGETLDWNVVVPPDIQVDIDRQDLQELVGIVLENAGKWAMTLVMVRAELRDGLVELRISDDGPGLPEQAMSRLGKRGLRLDESAEGTGLGLSIAREIVAINHGALEFARADAGGLQVRIVLVARDAA